MMLGFTERELLARIIQCEAGGEGDTGMRAVATVIMNRVNSADGEYLQEVVLEMLYFKKVNLIVQQKL